VLVAILIDRGYDAIKSQHHPRRGNTEPFSI
jgi:hypothetical protein